MTLKDIEFKRFQKKIKYPGTDSDVMLQVLTIEEDQVAQFETKQFFKDRKIDDFIGLQDTYTDERVLRVLSYALRDANNPLKPFASNIEELKKYTTTDIIDFLINEYHAFEKEVSPNPDNLTDDEYNFIIEGLKKNPDMTLLGNSSTNTLKRLIMSMVYQLANSQQDSGLKFTAESLLNKSD